MTSTTDRSSLWSTAPHLAGEYVELIPLQATHVADLQRAAADGELWRLWYTSVPAPDAAEDYVRAALQQRDAGRSLPFAVLDGKGEVVGSTRYCNIDQANRRLEIGWTWYARRAQRSALNTQAKRLLLGHAFEVMGCGAVEFRTSWFNHASRAAIERLGARQDGVLRNHMRMADGSYRDTVVFSILDSEWAMVRRHLDFLLESRGSR